MNVSSLVPAPLHVKAFEWNAVRHVPERSGCYVLATFLRVVLYVGRTKNLRARIRQHLDDDKKLGSTEHGRAVFFVWMETDDHQRIERTWANVHIEHEGRLPILNRVYPATLP